MEELNMTKQDIALNVQGETEMELSDIFLTKFASFDGKVFTCEDERNAYERTLLMKANKYVTITLPNSTTKVEVFISHADIVEEGDTHFDLFFETTTIFRTSKDVIAYHDIVEELENRFTSPTFTIMHLQH